MNISKKLYILCLLVALLYSIITSYLFILEEPTSFEETVAFDASFPTLTICKRKWWADNFITFLDVMEEIRGFHRHAETLIIYDGKQIEM